MHNEPVLSIGAVFTSLKVAVVAVLTVVTIGLELTPELSSAVIGAGAALTLAIGDIIGYILTRNRVSPVNGDGGN